MSRFRFHIKCFSLVAVFLFAMVSVALPQKQPGWMKKVAKAVCSISTFDGDGQEIGKGFGVFISNDGLLVTEYKTIADADSAVVELEDGKIYPVKYVIGADDIYDIAYLRADVKKSSFVKMTDSSLNKGDEVFICGFSKENGARWATGKVATVSSAKEGDYFYDLTAEEADWMGGCPIVNADGQLMAIAQLSGRGDMVNGCGVRMATKLRFDAFMFQGAASSGIRLLKAFPADENQAQVAMLMARSTLHEAMYLKYLRLYMELFPDSTFPYETLAEYYVGKDNEKMRRFLSEAADRYEKEDEREYFMAKFIYTNRIADNSKDKDFSNESALAHIQKAIRLNPLPLYYQLKGDLEIAMQQYAAALADYEMVNGSNMATPGSLVTQINLMALCEQPTERVTAVADSLILASREKIGADTISLVYQKAAVLENAGRYTDALRCLNQYAQAFDEQVSETFLYERYQVAMKAKRYQQAMGDIERLESMSPDNLDYKVENASLCIIAGQTDKAQKLLRMCLDKDASLPLPNRLMGVLLLQSGAKGEACPYLVKAKEAGDAVAAKLFDENCR